MSVPPLVIDLVERFKRNEAAYRSGQYNETQVRREFIDPFFECLGWDVLNRQGYAEAYKDVVHEDSLDVSGVKRAPDYCFRIGGTALAERLLTLHQQHTAATTDHERTLLERQITATDRQIDRLVYALYGLAAEEIALVEGGGHTHPGLCSAIPLGY